MLVSKTTATHELDVMIYAKGGAYMIAYYTVVSYTNMVIDAIMQLCI